MKYDNQASDASNVKCRYEAAGMRTLAVFPAHSAGSACTISTSPPPIQDMGRRPWAQPAPSPGAPRCPQCAPRLFSSCPEVSGQRGDLPLPSATPSTAGNNRSGEKERARPGLPGQLPAPPTPRPGGEAAWTRREGGLQTIPGQVLERRLISRPIHVSR